MGGILLFTFVNFPLKKKKTAASNFLVQRMGNSFFSFSSDSYHAVCANQPITNCRNDIPASSELPRHP